jgi:hypothetical protein
MTRVYENPIAPASGEARTRVLLVGAGRYPNAKNETARCPKLDDLDSVGPSVWAFVSKLMHDWKDDLEARLGTVDLLLSETAQPAGSHWPGLGVKGEVVAGTKIDEPTLQNVNSALTACLQGAGVQDHFLFLCCGHGFWKSHAFFILSDFGTNANNPWTSVIDLDGFRLGLSQEKPRHQWLFFDCCKDIPGTILNNLSNIGDPLIQANAEEIAKANKFGALSQFGLASSTPGQQAFGIPDRPSRFCEALIDALSGAGAISKRDGKWWVDDRGITDAVRSYAQRNPYLSNPEFYKFAMPISNDMPWRIRFRTVGDEPKSRLVAFSKPRLAMKTAKIVVVRDGAPEPVKNSAGRAKVLIELPARLPCKIAATFEDGNTRIIEVYGALPLAEPEEAEFIL